MYQQQPLQTSDSPLIKANGVLSDASPAPPADNWQVAIPLTTNSPEANPATAELVAKLAREAGFELCGIAPVEAYPELTRLPEWLARGYHGEMKYLLDSRREDPARVMDGARSVIVTALSYNRAQPYSTQVSPTSGDEAPRGWISRYAWGDDYHDVMKRKLENLIAALRRELPQQFKARAYVDTGPIHERIAAHHAGLGWLAKNTLLINEHIGSWFFLGVIVTDLDLPSASPGASRELPPDLCGTCSLCIDACPTGAIVEPYVLDARLCISYLTIELRGEIPTELRPQMGRMVYGCDICQDVCPWNHKASTNGDPAFEPRTLSIPEAIPEAAQPVASSPSQGPESLFAPLLEALASLSEEQYRSIFRRSAIKRAKWRGLVRNACVALGNSKLTRGHATHQRITALLQRLADGNDPIISEHARWALDRLSN